MAEQVDRPEVEQRLGEVLRDGDEVGLRYRRLLAHRPEKVWRALTESEHLRHWFPADIVGERRAGAALRLPFWGETVEHAREELEESGIDPDDAELSGELLAWEPDRLFEFTWAGDRLRFELEPHGGGTRLTLTVWLLGEQGPHGPAGTATGFHVCLDALEEVLDSGASAAAESVDTAALRQRYAAVVGD